MALNLDASRIESHFLGRLRSILAKPSGASVLVIDPFPSLKPSSASSHLPSRTSWFRNRPESRC